MKTNLGHPPAQLAAAFTRIHRLVVIALATFATTLAYAQNQSLAQPSSPNRVLELDGKGSYVELPPKIYKDRGQTTEDLGKKSLNRHCMSRPLTRAGARCLCSSRFSCTGASQINIPAMAMAHLCFFRIPSGVL